MLVYAKKDGDDRYESIQADPIEVTIRPAKLTIQVHNKTAAVGDPVPALTQADYTVSGLVGRDTWPGPPPSPTVLPPTSLCRGWSPFRRPAQSPRRETTMIPTSPMCQAP
ncbi:MAG: hypothetical protein ACLR1T_08910 [Evtepia gabavorous]